MYQRLSTINFRIDINILSSNEKFDHEAIQHFNNDFEAMGWTELWRFCISLIQKDSLLTLNPSSFVLIPDFLTVDNYLFFLISLFI